MISVDNFTITPGVLTGTRARQFTFSWTGSVDSASENPVQIDLTVQAAGPVFFLDVDGNPVKTVSWSTSAFRVNDRRFDETLFLRLMTPGTGIAVIRLTARNSAGQRSTRISSIQHH